MRKRLDIENIEQLRREAGIDDVELHEAVGRLGAGDLVRLTVLMGAKPPVALLVRITSLKGPAFRGKVARAPSSASLADLAVGTPVTFTADHIHSIPGRPAGA